MTEFNTAEDIAEEILYLTGKAILEHDDDVFISCVALPLLMETVNGQRVFISEDEVRHCLLGVRQHMKECDLVDFARTVVSAKFLDANTIGSTHVLSFEQWETVGKVPRYSKRIPLHPMCISSILGVAGS